MANPWSWVGDSPCPSPLARLRDIEVLAAEVREVVLAGYGRHAVVHCAGVVVGLAGEMEDAWSLARAVNRGIAALGRGEQLGGSVVVQRGSSGSETTIPYTDDSGAISLTLTVEAAGQVAADEMAVIFVGVDIRDRWRLNWALSLTWLLPWKIWGSLPDSRPQGT
ncbi:hypothetical protein GUY44_03010 [Pimelobacter simplex]|uniref:hypothetical protein n=1 Tax=Nocardioides simplex TaxID=2045 RepID=UPI001160875E|nr:hypothetical protein [Pimelobacter simplex]MCG8149436.1 hypothetical protein [Pimelobacter simplex]